MESCSKYSHILQPLRIGNTVFRNRIFSAPTGLYDLTPDRAPTDDYIAYYERKAKGGCASINIGECLVDEESYNYPGYEVIHLAERKLNKAQLSKLANAITRNGAVATIELQKPGMALSDSTDYELLLSPSDGVHPLDPHYRCRAMTEEEILETIESYASAAAYAKGRGFGMVMVHAGHGWLLHQFQSALTNHRTDKWGGNPENRCRFTVAVVDAIHERCGRDYPVEVRISGSEAVEEGYGIEEGVEIAKQLDGHADIIHVSCGTLFAPGSEYHTHPGIFQPEAMNVKYAAEIKKHVKHSYVATIGGLSDLDVLEEIVASGKADIVEMARGLICDPDLPLKAKSGREKEARKCLRCFKCVGQDYQDGRLFCAINPASGKEREAARLPQPKGLRKVLVAGGGIAGMQAAITAREIGHEVILCEKNSELGGVLLCEKDVPFKQRIGEYIERQKYMLEKLGVEVRLNTPVTPELCSELKPDAVIAAMGAVTATPPIPGMGGENSLTAVEVYTDASKAKGKCVILGAGSTGLELAIYLSSLGKEVRVLELRSAREARGGAATYMNQLNRYGINVEYGTKALEVLPNGIRVVAEDGEKLIECDTVINAMGRRPLWEEADALRNCAPEFHQIGDCRMARNLMATTSEAWTAARNIGCF